MASGELKTNPNNGNGVSVKLVWTSKINIEENFSDIHWDLYVEGIDSKHYYMATNVKVSLGGNELFNHAGYGKLYGGHKGGGSFKVYHDNESGVASISGSITGFIFYRNSNAIDVNDSWNLEIIPRKPEMRVDSVYGLGIVSCRVHYGIIKATNLDVVEYSVNDNDNNIFVANENDFVLGDLTPNTNYNIKFRGRNRSGTIIGNWSERYYFKTFDYAKILTATDFNDEENPKITYTNPLGQYLNDIQIAISVDGKRFDVPFRRIDKNSNEFVWKFTERERNILRGASQDSNSRLINFVIRSFSEGQTWDNWYVSRFTIINAKPDLAFTVRDTNSITLALTGDENTLIRYESNAYALQEATFKKYAFLKGYEIENGGKKVYEKEYTFEKTWSSVFNFAVADSRNNVTAKQLIRPFINYIVPTCNISTKNPTTDGKLSLKIFGNCYKGNFGGNKKIENTISLEYRKKEGYGEYGPWEKTVVNIGSNNTYNLELQLTGLDYRTSYTFQAKVTDKLHTIYSVERSVKTTPIFEWNDEYFNINGILKIKDDLIYPVGSIFISTIEKSPAEIFGGTWEKVAIGRTLIGAGTNYQRNTANAFGPLFGDVDFHENYFNFHLNEMSGQFAHIMSLNEMPKHNHRIRFVHVGGGSGWGIPWSGSQDTVGWDSVGCDNAGESKPFSLMPAYLAVNFWKRIA